MQIDIRQEAGLDMALYGFSLSYKDRAVRPEDWWPFESQTETELEHHPLYREKDKRQERICNAAKANAGRGKGHDKFLRQIMVWVDIEAPRYWWSEFDTYKVGTCAQSESTMHTLSKRDITSEDFEGHFVEEDYLKYMNKYLRDYGTQSQKSLLPEAYLQRRLVTMNYAVLRCIIAQRKNHRLPEWQVFISAIIDQVEHPELLKDLISE